MANQKLTALTLLIESLLSADNLLYMVDDPAGTPASRKVTGGMLLDGYYKIAPTVASNNLTVAIQHLNGSNPSASNPLAFKIGNNWKVSVAALSVTKNAGTNWCNVGGSVLVAVPVDFFVYVINETGASAGIKVGFSRIPFARTMADFVNTTTHERYIAGSWTNFNATDDVTNIGRFRAQLSAGAAYNWSIASSVVVHRPIYETDWMTHNVVLTNMTVGNATVNGRYKLSGRNLRNLQYFLFGSTSVITGSPINLTVPFNMESYSFGSFWPVGKATFHDSGSYVLQGRMLTESTSVLAAYALDVVTLTYSRYVATSSSIPMTWAAGDELMAEIEYEL